MIAGQIEIAKSYIAWMRGRNTLSLEGYYPGWENAARGSAWDDDTCAPSIVLEIEYGESTRCVDGVAFSDVTPVVCPVSASEVSRPKLPPIRAEDIEVKEAVHVIWSIEDWPGDRP